MFGKDDYQSVFTVGEIIESGAGKDRQNSAQLKILSIEDDLLRYKSIRSSVPSNRMKYSYLQMLLNDFGSLDQKAIQKSVNTVLKKAGFKHNYSTENYAYTLAKAFHERTSNRIFLLPGEHISQEQVEERSPKYSEGTRFLVTVERIERDFKARKTCIEHYGASCQACEFDFHKVYGTIGKDFIHVHHHRAKLSSSKGKYIVDPVKDLIPLCPNCHAMAHRSEKMLSVAKLRKILAEARLRNERAVQRSH